MNSRVETLLGDRPAIKRFNLALRPPQGVSLQVVALSFALSGWLVAWVVAWDAAASERGNRQPSIQTNKVLTGPRRLGRLKWEWYEQQRL